MRPSAPVCTPRKNIFGPPGVNYLQAFGPRRMLALHSGIYDFGTSPQFAESLTAAEEVLKKEPRSRMGLHVKIESLRLWGREELAMKIVGEALAHYPEDEEFWTQRALCCLSMNDPAGSDAADTAIHLSQTPNTAAWLAKLAFLCGSGEPPALLAAIKEAKALFPRLTLLGDLEKYYTTEQSKHADPDDDMKDSAENFTAEEAVEKAYKAPVPGTLSLSGVLPQ